MKEAVAGKRIRVYVDSTTRWNGNTLYNAIVHKALLEGMHGATVLQGIEGFGTHQHIHHARVTSLSLPVVIDLVDTDEKVMGFLPTLEEMVLEGLITVEDCLIWKCTKG